MSQIFRLDKYDFLRGAIVAVLVAVLTALTKVLEAKGLMFEPNDWQQILEIGFTAFIAYLAKNFATDNDGKLGGKLKVK